MIEAIGQGLLTGSILMLFVGPSFFFMLETGIKEGFAKAWSVAVGIMASDAVLLFLIFSGLHSALEQPLFKAVFSTVSGVIVLFLGIKNLFFTRTNTAQTTKELDHGSMLRYAAQGFLINVLNPFTIVVWVGVVGSLSVGEMLDGQRYMVFFAATLSVIFIADTLKAYFAHKLGLWLTLKAMRTINKVLGVAFIGLGLRFLWVAFGLVSNFLVE